MKTEDGREKPLKELYNSFPEKTREWIDSEVSKIRKYFIFWCSFVAFSIVFILVLIFVNLANEPIGTWIQRSGSLVCLLAGLAELIFIVKLKKMVRASHWAHLSCEIYIERSFKPLLNITIFVTALLVGVGTVIWGYGDLFYNLMVHVNT